MAFRSITTTCCYQISDIFGSSAIQVDSSALAAAAVADITADYVAQPNGSCFWEGYSLSAPVSLTVRGHSNGLGPPPTFPLTTCSDPVVSTFTANYNRYASLLVFGSTMVVNLIAVKVGHVLGTTATLTDEIRLFQGTKVVDSNGAWCSQVQTLTGLACSTNTIGGGGGTVLASRFF